MKVKELINLLLLLDQEQKIFKADDETGMDLDIYGIKQNEDGTYWI